jgi:hypothetical protein
MLQKHIELLSTTLIYNYIQHILKRCRDLVEAYNTRIMIILVTKVRNLVKSSFNQSSIKMFLLLQNYKQFFENILKNAHKMLKKNHLKINFGWMRPSLKPKVVYSTITSILPLLLEYNSKPNYLFILWLECSKVWKFFFSRDHKPNLKHSSQK